jgi:lipoprotein-releasing system ATP-binding protein
LDEPTGNLDEENAAIIQKLLFSISHKYNIALITATHDSNFIGNFDKIYKIQDMNLTEV